MSELPCSPAPASTELLARAGWLIRYRIPVHNIDDDVDHTPRVHAAGSSVDRRWPSALPACLVWPGRIQSNLDMLTTFRECGPDTYPYPHAPWVLPGGSGTAGERSRAFRLGDGSPSG